MQSDVGSAHRLALVAAAVLINSFAVWRTASHLRILGDEVRVAILAAAPRAPTAIQREDLVASGTAPATLQVEVYWDFACPFCRASVAAIDSVREALGD